MLPLDGFVLNPAWEGLPWLVHGFSMRQAGDFRDPNQLASLGRKASGENLALIRVRQIHSDQLLALDGPLPTESEPPQADGLATQSPGLLLSVRTADCLPLLIIHRERKIVAAVHAGWRGTAASIAIRAVELLDRRYSASPQELEVAIGPGIAACCFEVGPEVAEKFDPEVVRPGQRPHIDLVAENRRQLQAAGVPARSVQALNECTCCGEERYFSHRRDCDAAGRMVAVIGVLPTD